MKAPAAVRTWLAVIIAITLLVKGSEAAVEIISRHPVRPYRAYYYAAQVRGEGWSALFARRVRRRGKRAEGAVPINATNITIASTECNVSTATFLGSTSTPVTQVCSVSPDVNSKGSFTVNVTGGQHRRRRDHKKRSAFHHQKNVNKNFSIDSQPSSIATQHSLSRCVNSSQLLYFH